MLLLDGHDRVVAASPPCQALLGQQAATLQEYGLPLVGQPALLPPDVQRYMPQQIDWQSPQQGLRQLVVQWLPLPEGLLRAGERLLLLYEAGSESGSMPLDGNIAAVLQSARIGLCQFDLERRMVLCPSACMQTLLGLPSDLEQINLDDWLQRVHPEDRPLLEQALQAVRTRPSTSLKLEYRMQHVQQHWEWLELQLQSGSQHDNSHLLLALHQVITARKSAEASMRRREQEFRTLVENSSDIISRYDLELRCQFINRSINRYSPMIRDEHIGKTVREKGWPEELATVFESECRQLIDKQEPRDFELEFVFRNRRYIFETRLFPEFDSSGQLTSILSVDREITDSRQANRLLSEENAVMEMIASNQPLEDTLAQICTMIESQIAGGRCSVMLLGEDGQHLRVASGKLLPKAYLDIIDGIAIGPQVGSCGTAAFWKRTIIVEDMENSPLWQPYLDVVRRFNLRACWSIPIFSSSRELMGTFAIYYDKPRTPNPDEMRLVYRSSHITAIALQREQHEQKLFQLATMDELTGLGNRRHFLQQADRELKRSQRYQQPMAVLMMDLDHFKNINDQYGHATGDQVISHFAGLCRQVLRTSDLTGRLGGEEFAALLPNTDSKAALAAAERLRAAVNENPLLVNGQSIHYTVSLGLSLRQDSDQHVDDLLKRADKLLYQAKNLGRNRVCHDPELVLD